MKKSSVTDELVGKRTGGENSILTVVSLTNKRYKNGEKIWLCKCDCGNQREVKTSDLKKVKSCGCLKGRPRKNKELN